jgi:dihydroneopterin aldolase
MTGRLAALSVFVRGLLIEAEIGLNPDERGRRQPLIIDVTLKLEPRAPQHLRDTVNYERIVDAARTISDGGHVELVETFALRLAEACLAFGGVGEATVRIEKPQALKVAEAAGAEVRLKR